MTYVEPWVVYLLAASQMLLAFISGVLILHAVSLRTRIERLEQRQSKTHTGSTSTKKIAQPQTPAMPPYVSKHSR